MTNEVVDQHINGEDIEYDIIGDVHGCAKTLIRLLIELGYTDSAGFYAHPSRKVVYIGDIIDRGPHIREALSIVHAMVVNNAAHMVLGNHEINALCYCRVKRVDPTQYIHPRTSRNTRIIGETLAQFADFPEEWVRYLDWFLTLPLYLQFRHFRVVHACWDQALITEHERAGGTQYLSISDFDSLSDDNAPTSRLVQRLTTGLDLPLPQGVVMRSTEGFERHHFRAKFWVRNVRTYGDLAYQPDPLPNDIAEIRITEAEKKQLVGYDEAELPLFIGHYWLTGRPKPVTNNIVCLDYSAVKFGRLVAYRMRTESVLKAESFTWVYVDP